MYLKRRHETSRAFALPTVLIASIVLLTVLVVSVSATSAVRTTLKNQYYAQLAQVAGEAGVAYAKACLQENGNVPLWTDAKPLKPNTDCAGNSIIAPSVKVLVVAGGGGGGEGGGGGGGVIYNEAVDISAQPYTITVGAGGAGSTNGNAAGVSGSNSSAFGLTAIGGGRGGVSSSGNTNGANGGSGGGGRRDGGGSGGSGTAEQGNTGGNSLPSCGCYKGGGGGGGAGAVGGNGAGGTAATEAGGTGGIGIANNISGGMVYYGGGGGGGTEGTGGALGLRGLGGTGGGGAGFTAQGGSTLTAVAGTANTGGGGGGRPTNVGSGTAGAGGSGIVIISYPTNSGIVATGGTITTSDVNKIHTFTSSGTFTVTSPGTATCPTDPRCSVTVNGNIRSSFSVGLPSLDADGKAVTIPYNGYTEIIRTSNGSVWRTISQPSIQAAVVPDLCSGTTASMLGWNNAVKATTQDSISTTTSAQSITLANGNLNAGNMYFRKDFSITEPGSYKLTALTPTSQDVAELFIDNVKITSSAGSLATVSTTLSAGCHVLTAKLTNVTLSSRESRFTAALQKDGAVTPVAVTNNSWRVAVGNAVHFSSPNFYADPSLWTPVRDYANAGYADNWSLRSISTTHSYTGSYDYPASSYAFFRDMRTITVSSPTQVRIETLCDDTCSVYVDGETLSTTIAGGIRTSVYTTLQPGSHKFGVKLRNNSVGLAMFNMTAFRVSDGAILTQTDANWLASTSWTTTNQELYSYDSTFTPVPTSLPTNVAQVLVVGGGGSGGGGYQGGGGGGGGVVYNAAKLLTVGSYGVTVGAGGAGGSSTVFNNGQYSNFGDIFAIGGGAGAGETTSSSTYAMIGGSGGGSSHPTQSWNSSGFIGQGYGGGAGYSASSVYVGGGGGGAGAGGVAATSTKAGNGGTGVQVGINGMGIHYGAGGGGSFRGGGTSTRGTGGGNGCGGDGGSGGLSNNSYQGGAGGTNAGCGGGAGRGGTSSAGGLSGAGGSGVVVIAYPTGSMVATGGTITTYGGNTVHQFNSSGTFTITSIP